MMRTGNKPDDSRCTLLHSAPLQVVAETCHPDKGGQINLMVEHL